MTEERLAIEWEWNLYRARKGEVDMHNVDINTHCGDCGGAFEEFGRAPRGGCICMFCFRNERYERVYDITVKEYEHMRFLQKGRCCICGIHESEHKSRLYVDHDHDTGKVRGLLCHKCNTGLGFLCDSIEILEKALVYLKNNS
jgi:hypothetical protein